MNITKYILLPISLMLTITNNAMDFKALMLCSAASVAGGCAGAVAWQYYQNNYAPKKKQPIGTLTESYVRHLCATIITDSVQALRQPSTPTSPRKAARLAASASHASIDEETHGELVAALVQRADALEQRIGSHEKLATEKFVIQALEEARGVITQDAKGDARKEVAKGLISLEARLQSWENRLVRQGSLNSLGDKSSGDEGGPSSQE